MKNIVVEVMYFDSDDYQVETEIYPCDNKRTARDLVEKIYKKILEDYDFDDDKDREEWEESSVKRKENGSIYIEGGDVGYATIDIVEKEVITAATLSSFEIETSSFY